MRLPTIIRDGNLSVVNAGGVTVWFSYETAVAFQVDGMRRVVRENDWGPTTGKHLNSIDGGDKANRVSGATFQYLWDTFATEAQAA